MRQGNLFAAVCLTLWLLPVPAVIRYASYSAIKVSPRRVHVNQLEGLHQFFWYHMNILFNKYSIDIKFFYMLSDLKFSTNQQYFQLEAIKKI